MLSLTVASRPSREQLLEALKRLRKTPDSKAVQTYSDLLLQLEALDKGQDADRLERRGRASPALNESELELF